MEDNNTSNNKVLGIPTNQYAKICYMLILVSVAIGLVGSLLGLVGIYIGLGGLTSLMGLIGLALAVTAWVAFTNDFGDIDISHFRFLAVLFIVFFVFNIIVFNAIAGMGIIAPIVAFLIQAVQAAVIFAAFDTWRSAQKATVDNVKASFFGLKKYLPNK